MTNSTVAAAPENKKRRVAPPELLAPAGDWDCVRAAIENGADAIYFGLEKFNARMRAENFTVADLPQLMSFLHRRSVRGYVTFNTLVFEPEIEGAREYLRSIIASGVDAAIVQDIGVCRMIREISPDFPIHASTQMTISSTVGVDFARELGCELVVLARECSLDELNQIQAAQQRQLKKSALPIEMFVHGALCVAYSGQCLTSEVLGGRSANRGECAQACRMPYELIADGKKVDLGDRHYLLSPQDLAGISVLPELIEAGVASLKIEGRLKSPEYVASVVRVYRDAIDKSVSTQEVEHRVDGDTLFQQSRYDLEMSFSRGLYTGWFRGNNNQELAHARFGKKRGSFVGTVIDVKSSKIRVNLEAPLKAGDGVVFDHGNPETGEEGGRVFHVDPLSLENPNDVVVSFGRNAIQTNRIHPGDLVWKTSDPEFDKRVRKTFAGDKPQFQRPITVDVHGHEDAPLTLIVRDEHARSVRIESSLPLEVAQKSPLTQERLEQQLGRLGGTPFRLERLENHIEGEVILPISELNRLRRSAVEQLEHLRSQPLRWTLNKTVAIADSSTTKSVPERSAQLVVLCRELDQVSSILDCGVTTLYCDFENPKQYREAVDLVRTHNAKGQAHAEIFVAPPRIFKMGEEWILNQVRSSEPDGFLVRNYDHLSFFSDSRMVGDFSLNVANSVSARYFMDKYPLERLTASYDLNTEQLAALLGAAPASWFEVTLHQHMPMFHMEHCVFCAFLSKGKDYRDCGRPCDKHSVRLRDRVGMEHPLKADVGCRNTLFNARAQTGAEFYADLYALGTRRFRIEFVNEPPAEVVQTLNMYQSLLHGEISGEQLWRRLKLQNQLGVTRGQMGNSK